MVRLLWEFYKRRGGASSGKVDSSVSGILQIVDVMKQVYQHSMSPTTAHGNVNGGDLNFAQGYSTFFFYKKSIKREFAEMIDKFFSTYGYKVNLMKIPNIAGRRYFNYVKTISANVESANVPDKYLKEYKEMLNKGITFWHDTEHFLDYDVTNSIV